jgi:iron only hydrogenase large subunit-like protein
VRKSQENAEVKQIYEEFLEKPLGEKSHHLLHTAYQRRSKV